SHHRDRLSRRSAAIGNVEVGGAPRRVRHRRRRRSDRTFRSTTRQPTACDPRPSHLTEVPVRRGRGVVGRHPRRASGRPDFLPAVVRRRRPLGCDLSFCRGCVDDAGRWGVCAIEQDWMLLYWFGVRALRALPSRAAEWQRTLDALAAEADVGLIWSMATPADLVLAAALAQVVAVRTCDDYRFAADAALLWTWYLTVNRVVGPLGLPAVKDCFFSRPRPAGGDAIDGDEHAEVEALLACMSAGPVGIGDRLGCTNPEIVMRTCDDDARIRHGDHPLSLIDECLFGEPSRGERLAWATTTSTRAGEVWTYVVALNTSTDRRIVADKIALADIGVLDEASVYDWRRRTVSMTGSIAAELAPRDWALWVCAPLGERADTGDLDKYVTV